MKLLSDVIASRNNNLDFIRFAAALLVIFSHSFPVCYGFDGMSPLANWTNGRLSEGAVSVAVFFFFGGLLIAKSCVSHPEAKRFFRLRCLRIMPQLIFVVVLLALLLGPILSVLPPNEYFSNPETYKYLLNGVFVLQHGLPGVFDNNPYYGIVNGPLWTLPVEFVCYILCFICFKATKFEKKKFTIVSIPIIALLILYLLFFDLYQLSVVRALMMFYAGVAFYVYRDHICLKLPFGIGAILLWVVLLAFKLDLLAMFVVFPFACTYIGYGTPPKLANFAKYGEFSYGIYLWGWPIQQTLIMYAASFGFFTLDPIGNTVIAILLAIFGGIFNYYIVDRSVSKFLKWRRSRIKLYYNAP